MSTKLHRIENYFEPIYRRLSANDCRKMGIEGKDDKTVLRLGKIQLEKDAAQRWVDAVLESEHERADGKPLRSGFVVREWLGDRVFSDPRKVKELIEEFIGRDGKNSRYNNADIKAAIDAYLLKKAA